MDRRQFLAAGGATFIAALAAGAAVNAPGFSKMLNAAEKLKDGEFKYEIEPLPELSAAVDVIVPADPEIPGDFKGTDYYADYVVAMMVGTLGQSFIAAMLNKYAKDSDAGKKFLDCNEEEQLEAIRDWIRDQDNLTPDYRQALTGLLTLSMIGAYEDNDKVAEEALFESMGWYDPNDAAGTFHLPCEGYPDSYLYPVTLKKGLRQ